MFSRFEDGNRESVVSENWRGHSMATGWWKSGFLDGIVGRPVRAGSGEWGVLLLVRIRKVAFR